MSLDYIAIDFETANIYKNSACSVGLVRFIDGKETDSLYSLIHPAKMYFIPEWTEEIHHISYNDVRDKPYFPEVWDSLVVPFLKKTPDLPFIAHNAEFDMGVIRACFGYYGMSLPDIRYTCTLNLARKVWGEFDCHRLTYLAEQFGINYNAHEALDDARTCGKIYALAAQKLGVHSTAELNEKLGLCEKNLKI
ncbi:MAG: 3'-5' exoribonuclease [Treponema sp.]|nr:3'-5' exoribonuclease [Treponema sp.]